MATSWQLLNAVSTTTSTPTVYHEADGRCYSGSGTSGSQIDLILVTVPDSGTTSASISFAPRTGGINALDESDTRVTQVPSGHAGTATWSASGTTTTITFSVPTSGNEWGWNFENPNLPEPLHVKVKLGRP